MMKYWTIRTPREKLLMTIALSLIGVLFMWQYILKPISSFPKSQKQAFEKAQSDISFMRSSETILKRPKSVSKIQVAPGQLQMIITRTAALKNLPISRRQPNGDDKLTIWLEKVISVDVFSWVRTLTEDYYITLERINITRDNDGTIRVQATFVSGQ